MDSKEARRAGIRHLSGLDGLRGLALVGVLLFHANGALPGGYLGVDLFFVLSGYLITALLLKEHEDSGRIGLSAFWARRARRLLPALLSLMPAVALYAALLAKPSTLSGLRADALATLAYVANWRAILAERSYWELFAAPSPLEHTWSLAIEEQFYIVWPLAVGLLLQYRSRRALLPLTVALALASAGAMIGLFDPGQTSRVYLGTDTRASGILLGAALAMLVPPSTEISQRAARRLDVLGLLSAGGLGLAWCTLRGSDWFLYHGGFWLTELAVLSLIVCAVADKRSLVARALAFRPLTLLGTISYGAYLWHWPVNVVLNQERVPAGSYLPVLQLTVTFVIATVSYRFLERPIRTRGVPFGRPLYVTSSALGLAVALIVGATAGGEDASTSPSHDLVAAPAHPDGRELKLMLLGDSSANSLGWALRVLRSPGVTIELEGHDGCKLISDSCDGPSWAAKTQALRPQATLLFVGGAFLYGFTDEGRWRKSCYPEWDRRFEANLNLRLGDLLAEGTRVWVLTVPYPLASYDNEEYRGQVDCINASIRKSVAAVPGVRILDLAERLCPGGVCEREYEGVAIRPDGVHYATDGASAIARWVLEQTLL